MIRTLAEGAIYVVWLVVLYRYQPLRTLVRDSPRYLTVPFGLLTAAWLLTQLTNQRWAFYPLISVYMYGEKAPAPTLDGMAVHGEWCDGTRGRLETRFMGRARLRGRLESLYGGLAYRRTAADSTQRWDIIDRTLRSIGGIYNRTNPDRPLCAIGLDVVRMTAGEYEGGVIPSPRVVHVIPLR
jgi:hypothetical protein